MALVHQAFTATMLLAALLCLRDAWGDRESLTLFATAMVYGLVLEKLVIVAFEAYTYPAAEYLFQAGGVPVAIAFGWSAVIYAGTATARSLALARPAIPGFVALYALHVDLSMDAVAIRIPLWTWTPPGPWFGVPLGNFFGWFAVAALFAGWFEVLRRRTDGIALAVGTLVAAVSSLLVVLQAWVTLLHSDLAEAVVLLSFGALALLALVRWPPRRRAGTRTALAVALVFHLFFLAMLAWTGAYLTTPALALLALGMLAVGVGIHVWPGLDGGREGD